MKKILLFLLTLTINSYTYSQIPEKQYFVCDGVSFEGQLPVNSTKKDKRDVQITRKFSGSMVYRKNDPKNIKTLLDPEGFIVFSHRTYEVCWTDPVQLKFQKDCGYGTKSSSVKRIEEIGRLDKVTGEFYYENTYEYKDKLNWDGVVLTCKKVESPVVQ